MKYPFTPEVLDALPEELAELFRGLETDLLDRICQQLKAGYGVNEVTLQDIRALRSHGIDLKDIKKAIRNVTGLSRTKLNRLFSDAVDRNESFYTGLLSLSKLTAPSHLMDASDIAAIARQTNDMFTNITASMGFLVDGGQTMLPPAKAYEWALDNAALQVQSGVTGYSQAIASAVKQLADSGLKVVDYESGHTDGVDVAVRRAVLTGINQLNQQYREQSTDYLETDLVETTAHRGARDKGDTPENHKLWQGKVYRWSEKPRTSTGEYPDFVTVCGYGFGEGIGGWNCRHSFYPFVEGVSQRTWTDEQLENIDPPPFEYEGKTYTMYEATQKQRQIERSIRKQKRLETACKSAGLDEDYTAAKTRRRRLEGKYKEFSKAAGLPEQRDRIRIYELNKRETKNILSLFHPNKKYINSDGSFDLYKAKKDYKVFLQSVPEKNRIYLEQSFDAVSIEKTDNKNITFGFDPKSDRVLYNPEITTFKEIQFETALTHELSHRVDWAFFDVSNNTGFKSAIEDAAQAIYNAPDTFVDYSMAKDNDGFISDIFDAICYKKWDFAAGHDIEYWKIKGTREKEIFANMFTLEAISDKEKLVFIRNNFPALWDAYITLIGE